MYRISKCKEKGVTFGELEILSLLSLNDMVLLALSNSDLQLTLGQFVAKYYVAGLKIKSSKSEAIRDKRGDCQLWIREGFLPPKVQISHCPHK